MENTIRKKKIELHFEEILEGRTFEQIRGFYQRIIGYLIPSMILYNKNYNYEGFDFYMGDIPIITKIKEEFNLKLNLIEIGLQ